MVKSAILQICESITKFKVKFCVLCLRTQNMRSLSISKSLPKLIALMNDEAAWSWKRAPPNELHVCNVCEARMLVAVKVMDAIKLGMLSSRLLEYYKSNPTPKVELLDKYLVALGDKQEAQRNPRRSTKEPQPNHPLVHVAVECDSLVLRVRQFTTMQTTETLCVSSVQESDQVEKTTAAPRRNMLRDLLDKPADPAESEGIVHVKIEEECVEEGSLQYCDVLIENDIRLPGAGDTGDVVEVKEETEILLIDDDEDEADNDKTKNANANRAKLKTGNANSNSATQKNVKQITPNVQRSINAVPIEKLLSNDNSRQNFIIQDDPLENELIIPNSTPETSNVQVNLAANSKTTAIFPQDLGNAQMLAIPTEDPQIFVLHQFVLQNDGTTLLVPVSQPGRIVDGNFEMVVPNPSPNSSQIHGSNLMAGTTQPVAANSLSALNSFVLNTQKSVLEISPLLVQQKTQDQNSNLNALKRKFSAAVESARNNAAQRPSPMQIAPQRPNLTQITPKMPNRTQIAPQRPNLTQIAPQRPNLTQIAAQRPNLTQIAAQRPNLMQIAAQRPNLTQIASQRPNLAQIAAQRPLNPTQTKMIIDWEDKIPMDVISYMDATDPAAESQMSRQQSETPMGFISHVYSQKEIDEASSNLETIMQACNDDQNPIYSRVISIE